MASSKPLIVTARLGSPVVGDPTLPLDGVLLWAAMRRAAGGDVPPTRPGIVLEYDPAIVPLEIVDTGRKTAGGPVWFYACSFARWSAPSHDGVDHWNKRFDLGDLHYLAEDTRRVLIKGGTYKAYHQRLHYRTAREVSWAVRGDAGAIADLLSEVDWIGKHCSQGWGRVLSWRITPARRDEAVLDADGYPARAIPTWVYHDLVPDSRLDLVFAERGFRPPYWAVENQGPVFMPVSYA